MSEDKIPLCVDLDGTLIATDLLLESFFLLLRRNPLYVTLIPIWLLKGKAHLKAQIADRVTVKVSTLPKNADFFDWLSKQKQLGRSLWLCTASTRSLADSLAMQIPLFDGVLASDKSCNLKGKRKAARLVEFFGFRGFDYCGNSAADVAIWQVSRGAIVVNGCDSVIKKASRVAPLLKTFPYTGNRAHEVLRALRPQQWAKNILVFMPIVAAHQVLHWQSIVYGVLAFISFSLCASSVYLLNDLLDLEADRQHLTKSDRPFAAGRLPLAAGFILVPALLGAALITAAALPGAYTISLAAYYVLTLSYSFALKRFLLIDVLVLASLYTIRIIAGGAAAQIALSFWLILFSIFLFLSLALVKRYAELINMRDQGKLRVEGRGYHVEDLPYLQTLGCSAGYLSVLVLGLYINTDGVRAIYSKPSAIWALCILLLYWISRVWMIAHRGMMQEDPLVFALRDKVSLGIAILGTIAILIAV